MSDIAPQYYKAFCKANNCNNTKRLLCSWHVDKAWKAGLKEKVGNTALELELYLKLKSYQTTTNKNLFESLFQTFIDESLSSNVKKDFGEYLVKQWSNNKPEWAYCYRAGDGINTNMLVESFHKTLKYKYLNKKHNRRVDVLLVQLMKFARDQMFERLISLTKGKETARQHLIHERHLSSLKLNFSSITRLEKSDIGEEFEVKSEVVPGKLHQVTKIADECDVRRCVRKCHECHVCAHRFQCTCTDYLILVTCCKHIHLVKRFLDVNDGPADQPTPTDNSTEIEETFYMIQSSSTSDKFKEFNDLSDKLLSQLEFLRTEIGSCSSSEITAMNQLKKSLAAATNTFLSMRSNNDVKTLHLKENFPPNKHIEPQPKFKVVTKKRKKNTRVRLTKPTPQQQEDIFKEMSALKMRNEEAKVVQLLGLDDDITDEIDPEIINFETDFIVGILKKHVSGVKIVEILTKIKDLCVDWKCGACETIKYADMIECDQCLAWYHWACESKEERLPNLTSWSCSNCRKQSNI